ncbi:MAG: polyprenyl diphosphate synthase [Firmicutes bacterium]|nr:polyprenyl diphosphate synthase [Bacillota bacterium]
MPVHVAIIMDGNGRWAQQRGLPRTEGHRAGVRALKTTVKAAARMGIRYLTVYAFSTENWHRPRLEVGALMSLLVETLERETPELRAEGVRIHGIGNVEGLPRPVRERLAWAEAETAGQTRLVLNLALNYGGRDELVRAVNRWRQAEGAEGRPLTEAVLARYLDTAGQPDPDLLIRASGEERLSNFLLWQLAYTEIYVTGTLWPDFGDADLERAVDAYMRRERRFGGIG